MSRLRDVMGLRYRAVAAIMRGRHFDAARWLLALLVAAAFLACWAVLAAVLSRGLKSLDSRNQDGR